MARNGNSVCVAPLLRSGWGINGEINMSKQEQFLWLVQTAILANGINLAANADTQGHYGHCYSARGALALSGNAVRASERIPEDMSAYDAALEFCTFALDNLKHAAEDARRGKRLEVPSWLGRPDC